MNKGTGKMKVAVGMIENLEFAERTIDIPSSVCYHCHIEPLLLLV